MIKYSKHHIEKELTKLLNKIMTKEVILKKWKSNAIIQINKKEREAKISCHNNKSLSISLTKIKLLKDYIDVAESWVFQKIE